eukprot:NODE_257_length_2584_cov_22.956213_g235_i0.p1 GENE.NODE_257_length_2584_cov_22.956213_g235_i0~~NODE_257_length_2584_cov_22.956213_g235_i0.p1  ORF type:complete len:718 (-),score=167.08 NODE_257_length_2584_cov_22.956213_g235_i0:329-2482(-)
MSSDEPARIKVVMRIRPPRSQEKEWFAKGEFAPIARDESNTPNADTRIILDKSGKAYDYDKVFRDNCTQAGIFKVAAVPTLENVFNGYCGAVLAYGQTGTGKTHTMQGYDKTAEGDERGIIPRCADYIFNKIKKTPNYAFTVKMCFVQIYLDKLQDLFKPEAPEISINPETERVELPGITEHIVTSTEQFMKLYYYGEGHRVTRATLMNPTSSRGHAALIVNVRMEPQDAEGLLSTKVGKLVLVDLAGYERFALTGITTGIAAEEAKKINASLLALGNVVNALADKQSHIPYRNAKLTRLLKDCLGGSSKSTIVLTIGPCDKYKQETQGTLYFGWKAMSVKVDARVKEEYDPTRYIQNLKDKLSDANSHLGKVSKFLKSHQMYDKFKEKYGDLPEEGDEEEDEEQEEIINAMQRQQTMKLSRGATLANLKAKQQGMPIPDNLIAMTAEQLLGPVSDVQVDQNAAPEVQAVQKEWNREIHEAQEAAARELESLRLRHIQDLEEAKVNGANEEILLKLREEHEDDLRLMREQNMALRDELIAQKHKEEAKALLSSAHQFQISSHDDSQGDDQRISDMVNHLQETCGNKDEVLVRLFDLINHREAEIRDYETNNAAVVMAASNEIARAMQRDLHRAESEVAQIQEILARKDLELQRRDAELERLRRGGAGGPPAPGGYPPRGGAPVRGAAPPAGAYGAPRGVPSGYGQPQPYGRGTPSYR